MICRENCAYGRDSTAPYESGDARKGRAGRICRTHSGACSNQVARRLPAHRTASRGAGRDRTPGPARSGTARRRSGVVATQDRRLPPDAARYAAGALQCFLGACGARQCDTAQRASPDQPIRLRPRPRVVCRKGRGCAAWPPSRGVFRFHRHRHARAGADPRWTNQRSEAGPNHRAGAARRPA